MHVNIRLLCLKTRRKMSEKAGVAEWQKTFFQEKQKLYLLHHFKLISIHYWLSFSTELHLNDSPKIVFSDLIFLRKHYNNGKT